MQVPGKYSSFVLNVTANPSASRSAARPLSHSLHLWKSNIASLLRLLRLLDLAPGGDVLVVLVERRSEGVAAGAVGHEIELLVRHRMHHGMQRVAARIGDRARRQALRQVGVVWAVGL